MDFFLGDYHSSLFRDADKPNWIEELEFWKEAKTSFNLEFITNRIKELENIDGLQNNLFLPKEKDGKFVHLQLRKNFALLDINDNDLTRSKQADLYIIIAGIFHYLFKKSKRH